jgi:uncharacterized membrane protein YciS (DUF1049 family)
MKIQKIIFWAAIAAIILHTVTNWDTYSFSNYVMADGNYYFKKSGALFATDLAVALCIFATICVETKIGNQLFWAFFLASISLGHWLGHYEPSLIGGIARIGIPLLSLASFAAILASFRAKSRAKHRPSARVQN